MADEKKNTTQGMYPGYPDYTGDDGYDGGMDSHHHHMRMIERDLEEIRGMARGIQNQVDEIEYHLKEMKKYM